MLTTLSQDIRNTNIYSEVERRVKSFHHLGTGLIIDAVEIHVSPDSKVAVFSGVIANKLEGQSPTRICLADLESGVTRVLTEGTHTDRAPKYSPDGSKIAFLSDREEAGNFQLYFLDLPSGVVSSTEFVDGWVESLLWSGDGQRILLTVAGHGADISGGQGAVTSKKQGSASISWLPSIETGDESYRWRSVWVFEASSGRVKQVSPSGVNVWEASWCGETDVLAVVSTGPAEADWYKASLAKIQITTHESSVIYKPKEQLGWPSASPSGEKVAIVEAICSDRCLVAGDVLLSDLNSGKFEKLFTNSVDITHTEWRSEDRLFLAGHRGFETVVLEYNVNTQILIETWRSTDVTGVGRSIKPTPIGENIGDCLFVGESYLRAPEIGVVRDGAYRTLVSFGHGVENEIQDCIASVEQVNWSAPDGLDIQGWFLRPKVGSAPYPLVMHVHGGPVSHWRPRWLPRTSHGTTDFMLLKYGYAVFYPNPRGSSGRGQDFVRRVQGNMGGAETYDHLSGLDYLTSKGIVDPERIGVMGGSHGGFMTSWIITQDQRFSAAVAVAPVTDRVAQYLTCAHSYYVSLFLGDKYDNANGAFFKTSPIMYADRVKTPTLNIAGALDRCTPPGQAVEFHNALLENGARSVLVVYPEEGHGVKKMPAFIDYVSRIVSWFSEHMPQHREPVYSPKTFDE